MRLAIDHFKSFSRVLLSQLSQSASLPTVNIHLKKGKEKAFAYMIIAASSFDDW